MNEINCKQIFVKEAGYNYRLPLYSVSENGLYEDGSLDVPFCRGDKSNADVPQQTGILVEALIALSIHRLRTVNTGDLIARETALAITKLEEALMWLNKRSEDRKERGVQGTYNK